MTNQRQITVGLLWHSTNNDNFGVGALTASQVLIIERVAADLGLSIEFLILEWPHRREPYISGPQIRIFPLNLRVLLDPFRGLYSVFRQCDLVLDISGGDGFSDIYGLKRFLITNLAKAVVILARRPLILSPQTIGPFQHWWSRLIAQGIMRCCSAVVARDDLSFNLLRELNLPTEIIEATDVAFRLPYEPPRENGREHVRVGLNISGFLFNRGPARLNTFELLADYPELAHSLLKYFTDQPQCEVHLISHVIRYEGSGIDEDYSTAVRLAEEFQDAILAPRFGSPSEAKSYIASMDFFCGARMHACIAAFSSGVPVVPVAYSRKFAGLFGSLGYPLVADCKVETADEILSKVIAGFERRENLCLMIRSGRVEAERKLAAYETVLRASLTKAGKARA